MLCRFKYLKYERKLSISNLCKLAHGSFKTEFPVLEFYFRIQANPSNNFFYKDQPKLSLIYRSLSYCLLTLQLATNEHRVFSRHLYLKRCKIACGTASFYSGFDFFIEKKNVTVSLTCC